MPMRLRERVAAQDTFVEELDLLMATYGLGSADHDEINPQWEQIWNRISQGETWSAFLAKALDDGPVTLRVKRKPMSAPMRVLWELSHDQ